MTLVGRHWTRGYSGPVRVGSLTAGLADLAAGVIAALEL